MASPKSLAAGAFSLAVLVVGCVEPGVEDDGDATVVDGKGDGVTEFTLTLTTTTSSFKAKETPKLSGATSGSTASFTCANESKTDEGWRVICERGKEKLTLTYGPDDKLGAAIYVKTTSSPDKRSYYHCSATTATAGKWPGTLMCSSKSPKTIIIGQLVSPFSSSIDGIGIFNSHVVSEDASGTKLLRGMKPFRDEDFADLKTLGVDAVLIFKKPTGTGEVDEEIDALAPIGVPASRVVNVEFPWKDFADFEEPCRMTVRSLKQLKAWQSAGKTAFFHCTVGEDRTGYLAGLYRLLTEQSTPADIFQQEMCERGYSAGNPQKPQIAVVNEVDNDLTPLYAKMAFKIANGELSPTSLDENVCTTDPASDPAFAAAAEW